MPVSNEDILQLNARFTLADGQIAENVFHLFVTQTGTDSEVREACVRYLEAVYGTVEDIMSGAVDTLDILFRNLSDNAPTETLEWDTFTGGTVISSNQLPPGVAALVTGITGVAKTVGRKYIPGIAAALWNGTGWESAAMSALAAFVVAWIEDYTDMTNDVVLTPVVRRPVGGATLVFNSGLVRSEPAYQRRRREGVGD